MKIVNKRAYHDYELTDRIEAGVNLMGGEVKAVKFGHADLTGSHVRIIGSEAYLVNAKIFAYKYSRPEGYDEARTRKLLLHKQEIISLKSRAEGQKMTLVPVSLYDKKGFIKLEIALGKGKREFEKREVKKKKDLEREAEQEFFDNYS